MERKGKNTKETRRKRCPNSIVPNFTAHFQKIFLQHLEDLSTWVSIWVLQWEGMPLGDLSLQFGCCPHLEVRQYVSRPRPRRKSLAEPEIWISNSYALTTSLSFLSLTTQSISLLSCFLVRYNIMGLFLYSSTMVTWHYEIGTCHSQAMLFLRLPPKTQTHLSRLLSAVDTTIS